MKEILKYLRQTNNLTQAQIAQKLNLSRQSYIKYENGSVIPDRTIVEQLSRIYRVSVDFILQNKVPSPSEFTQDSKKVLYHIDESYGALDVASGSNPSLSMPAAKKKPKSYDAYFDGNTVRVLNAEAAEFKSGQRFKLIELSEEEEEERKNKSWEKMMKIIQKIGFYNKAPDDDPYYKEALYEALMEKYDRAD